MQSAAKVRSPPLLPKCTCRSIGQFGLEADLRCSHHQGPQRAVHVGQSENVWLDRCDAANRSSEPILLDNSNI
jgi:hypothetical protein